MGAADRAEGDLGQPQKGRRGAEECRPGAHAAFPISLPFISAFDKTCRERLRLHRTLISVQVCALPSWSEGLVKHGLVD